MQFRFKDKENPLHLVSNVVHSMLVYPLNEVLSANYLLTEWKPELIEEVMDKLHPGNSRIIIVGQKAKDKCTEEEQWYKTNYYFEKIEQSAIDVNILLTLAHQFNSNLYFVGLGIVWDPHKLETPRSESLYSNGFLTTER